MKDTKEMLNGFLDKKVIELEFTSATFAVEGNTTTLELSEQGNAGISGYRGTGVATNKDTNFTYSPTRARGIGRQFGLYHQAFLESQSFQDGWGKIEQGLVTSHWQISPSLHDEAGVQDYLNRQAKAVQAVLFGIDGGWSKHIREALYMLIGGFAPFLKIVDGLGILRGLSFRYPSQVRRWITDENEQYWLGIEFDGAASGEHSYTKYADELLLYQFRAIGNDFEGISLLRSVYVYIEALKLFQQLEAVAAEKFGSPIITVERPTKEYDNVDDNNLVNLLDSLIATDNGIILLPGGYKVNVSSPQGQMPNFEQVKRYCDEKIATILSAEGSLIGLNGKGAYNLAEIKDDQQLRSLAYYAKLICDGINDKSSNGHESLISFIVKSLTDVDGEDLSILIDGCYPSLSWALSPEQDNTDLTTIISLFEKGIIAKSDEDEDWLRAKLKMLPRTKEDVQEVQIANAIQTPDLAKDIVSVDSTQPEAPVEKVSDTALNGAQVQSALVIAQAVAAKTLPERSGIELLKMAFLIDEAQAAKILNINPAKAPEAGEEILLIPSE